MYDRLPGVLIAGGFILLSGALLAAGWAARTVRHRILAIRNHIHYRMHKE